MTRVAYDLSTEGHRESYFRVFEQLWNAQRVVGRNKLRLTLKADECVYLSVDDYFIKFFILCFTRSFLGKKTFGLLLRAENLVLAEPTAKRALKMVLLKVLKLLPKVTTIGIIPFEILPGLRSYLKSAIWDLQYWDVPILFPNLSPSEMAQQKMDFMKDLAGDRQIVLALGRQDEAKGTLLFFDLWKLPEVREKFLFGIVGVNRSIDPSAFEEFKKNGGFLWEGSISEEDLISSYKPARMIWCCYSPEYDVSSGIYGRGLQMKKTCIVREGSLISNLGQPCLKIPYEDVRTAAGILLQDPENTRTNGGRPDFKKLFDEIFL